MEIRLAVQSTDVHVHPNLVLSQTVLHNKLVHSSLCTHAADFPMSPFLQYAVSHIPRPLARLLQPPALPRPPLLQAVIPAPPKSEPSPSESLEGPSLPG